MQTVQTVMFDLGLHCLPRSHLWDIGTYGLKNNTILFSTNIPNYIYRALKIHFQVFKPFHKILYNFLNNCDFFTCAFA